MWDKGGPGAGPSGSVLIPYSSGMGVGHRARVQRDALAVLIPYSSGMGVGPPLVEMLAAQDIVLIPYSSGMGVGHQRDLWAPVQGGLNTLFVRYGCGTNQDPKVVYPATS